MEYIISLLWGLLKSFLIGIVLLIISIYSLPSNWFIRVVRYINPKLLKEFFTKNDKYFHSILSILLDGNYTDNYVDEEQAKYLADKIKVLKKDLSLIETNLFTIDLIQDLFNTLNFVATNNSMKDSAETIDNIANYFRNYTNRLEETSYRRNFANDVMSKFEEMIQRFNESREFEGEEKLGDRISKINRGMYAQVLDIYLKNETKQLKSTRDLILDSIKKNAIDLMSKAK